MPRQSKTTTPGAARATTNGQAGDPAGGSLYVEHLEQDFWDRASLRQIYDAALMLHCSPWAVLAHCVARALSLIDPRVTLPDVICGPGSLNWFAAIAAASAGSKGGATTVARQLVPVATPVRNLGSGEGLVDQYMSIATKGNPAHHIHRSLIFSVNEIDDDINIRSISGTTTISMGEGNDIVRVNYTRDGAQTNLSGIDGELTLHGQQGSDQDLVGLAGQASSRINVFDQSNGDAGLDSAARSLHTAAESFAACGLSR